MLTIPLAACLVTCFSGGIPVALETGMKEGQLFPDLVLPALADGKPRSISEFRGKKTLLIVFASW